MSENRVDPIALTPESREQQLIAKAERLAEKKLDDGTASNALIIHYLNLASTKAALEKELLMSQVRLNSVKGDNLQDVSGLKKLFEDASRLFKIYTGEEDIRDEEI